MDHHGFRLSQTIVCHTSSSEPSAVQQDDVQSTACYALFCLHGGEIEINWHGKVTKAVIDICRSLHNGWTLPCLMNLSLQPLSEQMLQSRMVLCCRCGRTPVTPSSALLCSITSAACHEGVRHAAWCSHLYVSPQKHPRCCELTTCNSARWFGIQSPSHVACLMVQLGVRLLNMLVMVDKQRGAFG